MKKIVFLLVIAALKLTASGVPTVDIGALIQAGLNYAQQIEDAATQLKQYEQLTQQLKQQMLFVKMQQQNLQSLKNFKWDDLGNTIYQLNNVMGKVHAISYDLGNVSNQFENTYKDFTGYSNELNGAKNEEERNKAYSDRYKQITQSNQNTLNGTLQQLEMQSKDLDSETKIIEKLKQRSQDSKGNLEVIQATNDLLAYEIDEIRKLRLTIMNQTNAMTNYMAAQNNEKILERAKNEEFLKKDDYSNPYDHPTNANSYKW